MPLLPNTLRRYIGTAPNSTEPGYYWVNTYNLPSRPLYTIPALTAHEAVPGHHLQSSLNAELQTLFHNSGEIYVVCLWRGMGLYTESLAEEMGIAPPLMSALVSLPIRCGEPVDLQVILECMPLVGVEKKQ